MKKATATSQGSNRFTDSPGGAEGGDSLLELAGIILMADSISGLRVFANDTVAAHDYILHPHPFADVAENTAPVDSELKSARVLDLADLLCEFDQFRDDLRGLDGAVLVTADVVNVNVIAEHGLCALIAAFNRGAGEADERRLV
jgi:hypothetical protein